MYEGFDSKCQNQIAINNTCSIVSEIVDDHPRPVLVVDDGTLERVADSLR